MFDPLTLSHRPPVSDDSRVSLISVPNVRRSVPSSYGPAATLGGRRYDFLPSVPRKPSHPGVPATARNLLSWFRSRVLPPRAPGLGLFAGPLTLGEIMRVLCTAAAVLALAANALAAPNVTNARVRNARI